MAPRQPGKCGKRALWMGCSFSSSRRCKKNRVRDHDRDRDRVQSILQGPPITENKTQRIEGMEEGGQHGVAATQGCLVHAGTPQAGRRVLGTVVHSLSKDVAKMSTPYL